MKLLSWVIAIGYLLGAAGWSRGASEVHQKLVDEYMAGEWDTLQSDLAFSNKELRSLDAAGQLDVKYMRQALSECRPIWWKQCKLGIKTSFRPTVWGQAASATYEPAEKLNLQLKAVGNVFSMDITWPAAEMDNPKEAEHGFTVGELNDLGIWQLLGMGQGWSAVPLQAQLSMREQERAALQRYLDFRANVSSVYYGMPRARRWGLWLYAAGYLPKYARMPTVMSRRAVGAMLVAAVAEHPEKFPSIRLPEVPEQEAEATVALSLKDWIEKHPWSFAEDKLLREEIAKFASANQLNVLQGSRVKLPSGQFISLDPKLDAQNQPARDAWVQSTMRKTHKFEAPP